jgi:hypothetical protein
VKEILKLFPLEGRPDLPEVKILSLSSAILSL